ncbi:hypothetical protein AB0I22_25890 [Streptomyces sp. NPDC050610]|uniref:hypothetical protein n=1 Tax=Streptomyces sp. NPDC050610 TaxID=3157097 RepID=UPI00343800A7
MPTHRSDPAAARPNTAELNAAELNAAIHALWASAARRGGGLTSMERREYERLRREWLAAMGQERCAAAMA